MAQESTATVIDLAAYRRRRKLRTEPVPASRAQLVWLRTSYGYWVPQWSSVE